MTGHDPATSEVTARRSNQIELHGPFAKDAIEVEGNGSVAKLGPFLTP